MRNHYSQYWASVRKIKSLSPDQEFALFARMKNGDSTAREIIFNHYAKFVVSTAQKFLNRNIDIMDLIMAGNVALLQAIDNFDIDLGYRFITFAHIYIEKKILNEMFNLSYSVKFPNREYWEFVKFKKIYEKTSYLDKANIHKLAVESNLSKEKVFGFLSIIQTSFVSDQNSHYLDEYNKISCENVVNHINAISVIENDIATTEMIDFLFTFIQEREAIFIKMYYGIGGYDKCSYAEIGSKYGISAERVRQVIEAAKKRLRENVELNAMFSLILSNV